jgi:glutathione S-transferase
VVDEDTSLFESAVICEFIDEVTPGSLHPEDPFKKAYHRAWIEFGSEILNNIGRLYNAKKQAGI